MEKNTGKKWGALGTCGIISKDIVGLIVILGGLQGERELGRKIFEEMIVIFSPQIWRTMQMFRSKKLSKP